jgi:hypothetical protein
MKYILLSGVLFLLLINSSCYRIYCTKPPISLSFSGFDSSELASAVIIKYQKNGSFSHALGTTVYIPTENTNMVTPANSISNSDTVYYYERSGIYGISIDPNNDYVVQVPATGETYKIKAISFGDEHTQAGNADGCTSSMSCYVNDKKQQYAGYYYGDWTADIKIVK